MYQIIGVQRNQEQRLLATPTTACEALAEYRAEQFDYTRMIVHAPSGEEINGFDLNRLADLERGRAVNLTRTTSPRCASVFEGSGLARQAPPLGQGG